MEKSIDFSKLYELQDKVLGVVFSLENDFFLTGGTALHRFYYNKRYSNDLDFFTNEDPLFSENISQILEALDTAGLPQTRTVRSKDFQRILVCGSLQLDFVNDRVYREGKSILKNNVRVDNLYNILTNKLAAILDRDEEKDIFDVFCIALHEPFNWEAILGIVNKKAMLHREYLIERIRQFPLEWLENIKTIQNFPITPLMVQTLCRDMQDHADNSLVQQ